MGSAIVAQENQITAGDLLTYHPAEVKETRRRCPICGKKMDKVWTGKTPRVLIDICPAGDGIWLDGGELHDILQQMSSQGSPGVISFLGEAFQATHLRNKKC